MGRWYRLDSAAKVFPAAIAENNSTVFRGAVILTEPVDPDKLQQAVDIVLKRFPTFAARLRNGLFWNYLYENNSRLMVEKEQTYPSALIDPEANNGFMIKILYHSHRLAVEFFHGLTDGVGALEFLKTLVYQYLLLTGKPVQDEGILLLPGAEPKPEEAEDSYQRYYQAVKIEKMEIEEPHRITGTVYKPYGHHVTHLVASASELTGYARRMRTSLTGYIASLLIQAIYMEESKRNAVTKPIIIGVPVDLRRLFPSQTLRNFYIGTRLIVPAASSLELEDLVNEVTKQLKQNVAKEHLQLMMAATSSIRFERIPGVRIVPLMLKNLFIRQLYKRYGDTTTMNLSNLGKVSWPESAAGYIKGMEFVSYPKARTPINCAIGSCNNRLNISFVRNMVEDGIIRRFAELLSTHTGLEIEEYSNNWGAQENHPLYPDYRLAHPAPKRKVAFKPDRIIKEWRAIMHR